jgi:hypothetical protein
MENACVSAYAKKMVLAKEKAGTGMPDASFKLSGLWERVLSDSIASAPTR